MATRDRTTTGGTGPSFKEVIDDNAPYIGAMYVLNLVLFLAFVDLGGLASGRIEYTTLMGGDGTAIISMAGAASFAVGFVVATILAVVYSVSILKQRESGDIDPYALEERISVITVVPAIQLFAVILCPVITGYTLAEGMQFLPQVVGALL